eukprot:CAMPEP_0196591730 /NCGR_PEP_ID=MMETSP1081-20130531/70715_1 /TAXON_ID=36882 /ORGANISM="Pyramimonas amylifera, Strain CCMP720" /LENGTH=246 /DNA_ID=CAMNT_0041915189 /DNA_START=137 /DNA_END=877 /DNA_ORIENTATION=-
MNEFDDTKLVSDYRFLEDVNETKQAAKRSKPSQAISDSASKRTNWQRLKTEALGRGVEWLMQAEGMEKRRMNTSFFMPKKQSVMWRVRWVFASVNIECIDARAPESQLLITLLSRHLEGPSGSDGVLHRHSLRKFKLEGTDTCHIFLESARCPGNSKKYFELDLQQTLASQLSGKVIIEFPTFHVVLPKDKSAFPLFLSSDKTELQEESEKEESEEETEESEEESEDDLEEEDSEIVLAVGHEPSK